jgi:hypothetical protein
MMRPHYYLSLSLASLLLVILLVCSYHYKADRWGVFSADFQTFHDRILINKLYLKTRYLLTSPHRYDCFLFGSSRVAALDAGKLGQSCYNFTHSGGLVVDHLKVIKMLLAANFELGNVFVALDDLAYNENPQNSDFQHMRRGYPGDVFEMFDFLSLFLLRPLDVTDLSLVTGKRSKTEIPRFIINPNLDTDRIRTMYQKYLDSPELNDKRFRRLKSPPEAGGYYGGSTVAALRELKRLARTYNFELHVFFLPLHYKTYLTRNYESLFRFKRDAAQVVPFRDFSGLNSYTTDNRYWRETSHFSAYVGDRILSAIILKEADEDGIGRLITGDNIDQMEDFQLLADINFLPELMRREGLVQLPQRYRDYWLKEGMLAKVEVENVPGPSGSRQLGIAERGRLKVLRGDEGILRQAAVRMTLGKGSYYLLKYRFYSRSSGRIRLLVSHDKNSYEGRFREITVRMKPGLNEGIYAGYASVKDPLIRLHFGGGDLDIDWRPITIQSVSMDAVAPEQVAYRSGTFVFDTMAQ